VSLFASNPRTPQSTPVPVVSGMCCTYTHAEMWEATRVVADLDSINPPVPGCNFYTQSWPRSVRATKWLGCEPRLIVMGLNGGRRRARRRQSRGRGGSGGGRCWRCWRASRSHCLGGAKSAHRSMAGYSLSRAACLLLYRHVWASGDGGTCTPWPCSWQSLAYFPWSQRRTADQGIEAWVRHSPTLPYITWTHGARYEAEKKMRERREGRAMESVTCLGDVRGGSVFATRSERGLACLPAETTSRVRTTQGNPRQAHHFERAPGSPGTISRVSGVTVQGPCGR